MTAMLFFSLIAGAALSLLWGAWRLTGLARSTNFGLNRTVLVASLLLSMAAAVVPFLPSPAGSVEIGDLTLLAATAPSPAVTQPPVRLLSVATAIFCVGFAASVIWLLLGLANTMAAVCGGRRQHIGRYSVLVLRRRNVMPFTWGRWIVMSEDDYAANGELYLRHELAHLRAAHWADLLLARLVSCLCWYWPTAWLLTRDLAEVHEFQADRSVLRAGVAPRTYQLQLINRSSAGIFATIANPLNFSSLKKRITMMQKKQSPASRRLRALAMLPVAALVIYLASQPAVAAVAHTAEDVAPTAVDVSAPSDTIYDTVEVLPQYPGGEEAMFAFLAKTVRYPEKAAKENVQGRVVVKFAVMTDGSISDVSVIKGVATEHDELVVVTAGNSSDVTGVGGATSELDAEAVRVVKAMPKWTPGMLNGQPVNCYYALPISFKLQ